MQDQPVQGISIEMEDKLLTIVDITKPIWHGDYHNGKLSIFHVQVNGVYSSEVVTVVSVFTDEAGEDFVFISDYDSSSGGYETIASHICALVIIEYAKQKSMPLSTYVPGTNTLQ